MADFDVLRGEIEVQLSQRCDIRRARGQTVQLSYTIYRGICGIRLLFRPQGVCRGARQLDRFIHLRYSRRMDPTKRPAVVIDNGTGYTKVRFVDAPTENCTGRKTLPISGGQFDAAEALTHIDDGSRIMSHFGEQT